MHSKLEKLFEISESELRGRHADAVLRYAELLLEWNSKINLISRKDTEQIFEQHIAPSLSYYLLHLISENDEKVVDIGSGGGLPAIINAISFPDKKFVLIDSTKKKVMVLKDIIDRMSLKNCKAIWSRAEEISFKHEHRNRYDICTSRGLAALGKLIPLSLPFLKKEGLILALKGGDLEHEIKGIKKKARYEITEYEMDERFHYIDRFKSLKILEIQSRLNNS